jgi:hypothetical protein
MAPGMAAIGHESSLERDFVALMRFDPEVLAIEEQPVTISWSEDGRNHRYTPDYRVARKGGAELVEIKYRTDLKENWDKYRRPYQVARDWARQQGMECRIATDRSIRCGRLLNAKRLLPRMHDPIDGVIEGRILRYLAAHEATPFSALSEAITSAEHSPAAVLATIWALIARRHVAVDLDVVIDGKALLSLPVGM